MLVTKQARRILLVDDHPLVRTGVRLALNRFEENEIIGEAANGDDALRQVLELRPDFLVIDVEMPGMSSSEVITQALAALPGLKVLVLTSHADAETLRKIRRMPISGYLLKDEPPEHLMQALRTVEEGSTWYSQSVAHQMMGIDAESKSKIYFTPREWEVLTLISEGRDNAYIAKQLSLAEQTVRNYSTTIYEKIGVASRVEAVIWSKTNEFA